MENIYSIGVENRYQLFLDSDDDPLEVLKISEQEGSKKKNKPSEKVNKCKEEDAAPGQVAQKLINDNRNSKLLEATTKEKKSNFNKAQVTKIYIKDGNEVKNNKDYRRQEKQSEDQTPFGFSNKKDHDNRYERKANAVRNFKNKSYKENKHEEIKETGGTKSANQDDVNGRGSYQNRGRKQFDRLSRSNKTGIKPIDKREGGGAHNWGSYQDELNDDSNLNNEQDFATQIPDEPNTELDGNEEGRKSPMNESDKPELQEEPKEMTLDEYYALKGNRQKPMYNLRKPNEGEDPSQWKNMYTLSKRENIEEEEEEEYERIEYPQRAGRQKLLLGIKYFFKDRFGRVGRIKKGGPRVESTKNNSDPNDSFVKVNEGNIDKSCNFSQYTPKLNDEKDFPSLG